jgi:hypothetical protein
MSHYDPAKHPPLLCTGCKKTPAQIGYETYRTDENGAPLLNWSYTPLYESDDDYIWNQEGTLNTSNGHFLCDLCYIAAGSPSSRFGWTTP